MSQPHLEAVPCKDQHQHARQLAQRDLVPALLAAQSLQDAGAPELGVVVAALLQQQECEGSSRSELGANLEWQFLGQRP